jgi:hypothetical protein
MTVVTVCHPLNPGAPLHHPGLPRTSHFPSTVQAQMPAQHPLLFLSFWVLPAAATGLRGHDMSSALSWGTGQVMVRALLE